MERANNDLVKIQLLVIEKFKDKQRTNTFGNDCNFVYSLWPQLQFVNVTTEIVALLALLQLFYSL